MFLARVHRWYIVTALCVGVLMAYFTPPFQNPDEPAHFFRAWQISQGHLVTEHRGESGMTVPTSFLKFKKQYDSFAFAKDKHFVFGKQLFGVPMAVTQEDTTWFKIQVVNNYNPVMYAPQVAGILVAEHLDPNPWRLMLAARLFNLLACVGIVAFAISRAPAFKQFFGFTALLPATMQAFTSVSGDGVTIAAAILLAALLLRAVYDSKTTGLSVAAVLVACTKITYIPLIIPVLYVYKSRLRGTAVVGTAVVIALLWLRLNVGVTDPWMFERAADTSAQLQFILHNPLSYLVIVADSLMQDVFGGKLGASLTALGWVNRAAYPTLAVLMLVMWVKALLGRMRPDVWRLPFVLAVALSILLIYTAVYLYLTPVGSLSISHVQGRYFLPVLAFLPFVASMKIFKPRSNPSFFIGTAAASVLYSMAIGFY